MRAHKIGERRNKADLNLPLGFVQTRLMQSGPENLPRVSFIMPTLNAGSFAGQLPRLHRAPDLAAGPP